MTHQTCSSPIYGTNVAWNPQTTRSSRAGHGHEEGSPTSALCVGSRAGSSPGQVTVLPTGEGKLFEPPMNIQAAHKSTHFHGKACLPFTHVPQCLRYCCELALDIPFNLLRWHVLVLFLVKEDGIGVLLLFLVQEVTLSVNLVTTFKTWPRVNTPANFWSVTEVPWLWGFVSDTSLPLDGEFKNWNYPVIVFLTG